MKLGSYLTLYTKITQNGLKMKLRHESVKFLGKKIGEKLHDSGLR